MKKIMKKFLCLLLSVGMLLPFATACTQDTPPFESCSEGSETESESVSESATERESVSESDTETETEPVIEDIAIATAGNVHFEIVYHFDFDDLSFLEKDYAKQIQNTIEDLTDAKVTLKDDYIPKGAVYNSDSKEILVGITSYNETTEALNMVNWGDFIIATVGNKIVITAPTTTALAAATEQFVQMLENAVTEDKSIIISGDTMVTGTAVPMLNQLPSQPLGNKFSLTDAGDNSYVLVLDDISLENHNTHLSALEDAGYIQKESNKILNNDNQYALYVNDTYAVTAIHTAYNNASRLIIEPINKNAYVTYENTNTNEVTFPILIQMGTTPSGSEEFNGMSYVVRLSNGEFLVWDGGYNDSTYKDYQNCQRLLQVMKQYAPNSKKIVIAAWLITHPHADHIGAFEYFCENYAGNTQYQVKNILINNPSDFQAMTTDDKTPELYAKVNQYRASIAKLVKTGTALHKCHPGQTYNFGDAVLEILYTHDLRAEKALGASNNLSIVSKLTVAGQTILFNGDTHTDSNKVMIKMYGEDLKVDFYQAPHHSIGPNDPQYPQLAAPKYTLIPLSPHKIGTTANKDWIKPLINTSKIFYAGFDTTIFLLPYDGSDDPTKVLIMPNVKYQ